MLGNNLIGFDGNKKFLPNDFDEFNSITKLRQLFLNLSNNIFKCSCQFSKYEQNKLSKYTLVNAFTHKIKDLMPLLMDISIIYFVHILKNYMCILEYYY